ncbi:alpha-mannosidase [Tanacetum coccineum]
MWTMGDDFQYQYAESWFKEMDKLIHMFNNPNIRTKTKGIIPISDLVTDGRVNALYSTPSIYTDAKLASNVSWPLKIDDYFPYAEWCGDSYWSQFTSQDAEVVVTSALSCLTSSTSNCTIPTSTLSQVKDANVVVQDSEGNTVEAQLIKFNSVTSNLRSFYTEAYLGISPQDVPKYWLLFRASVPIEVIRGPLVDEVHQQFNPWIYQVTRLYKDKEHAEFEFIIGPVPTDDGVGKEVITRITANMATNKVLYTDSNGRDFLKRVRNYREDWPLQVTQPVAGNYYPLNLGMYATDNKTELSMLVDRATGGASINDGQMEVMLHRGVDESLDETVCNKTTCQGLAVRGNYYMSVDQAGSGSRWRRTTGQEIVSPLLLAFTHEAGEDVDLSTIVKVELKKMFAAKTIKAIKETSLSANQDKSAIKRMPWKVEGGSGTEPAAVRGGPIDPSALIVELGPMEIRTFILQI